MLLSVVLTLRKPKGEAAEVVVVPRWASPPIGGGLYTYDEIPQF
jgi:hypothetical protein